MEDFLAKFIGKKIDVYCGGASSLRGECSRSKWACYTYAIRTAKTATSQLKRLWWFGKLGTMTIEQGLSPRHQQVKATKKY